ncbi:MAG TPA: CARDB domain-containing protein [Solirubrobacteraceae bacterium]|nr:CARDB domain-containing protein [Solirubrobacteraceae bacterium]
MSSKRLVGVGAVAACAVAIGSATASAQSSPTPRNDQLRSFVCQKALDPPARAVSVQAVMRPVAGTSKMQMKFQLMRQNKPHARFVAVKGRGLGSWISPSDPTLGQRSGDVWILNHPVVNLAAPATYKFKVTFEWIGAQGQTLDTETQASPTCYQPELRADLLVRSLTVTPITSGAAAGQWAYTAQIANRGLSGAGPVEVVFTSGNGAPVPATVAWVGARSSARQRFAAAPCTAGTPLTVTVDPTHSIDEYDFANNALTMECPATPSS